MRGVFSSRSSGFILALAAGTCLMLSGCTQRVYAPPPPGVYGSPLIHEAEERGYRAGFNDGSRDLAYGTGYHPRHDRKYAETPGYDPSFGPYPPYRDTFRNAYLRGYANGFNRR